MRDAPPANIGARGDELRRRAHEIRRNSLKTRLPSSPRPRTLKGKGVSFMEGRRNWHADVITPEQYARLVEALREPLP